MQQTQVWRSTQVTDEDSQMEYHVRQAQADIVTLSVAPVTTVRAEQRAVGQPRAVAFISGLATSVASDLRPSPLTLDPHPEHCTQV